MYYDDKLRFTNGALDINTMDFTPRNNTYAALSYEYNPFINMSRFEQIMNAIIPNKNQRYILYTYLMDSMCSKNRTNNLHIPLLKNINILIKLIVSTIGKYIHEIDTKLINNLDKNYANQRIKELKKIKNKKICILQYHDEIKPHDAFRTAINYNRNINIDINTHISLNCNLIIVSNTKESCGIYIDINDDKLCLLNTYTDNEIHNLFMNLLIKYYPE